MTLRSKQDTIYIYYSDGSIFDKIRKTYVKTYFNKFGYLIAYMYNTHSLLNRIIYEIFNGKIPVRAHITHINGSLSDNDINNLKISSAIIVKPKQVSISRQVIITF